MLGGADLPLRARDSTASAVAPLVRAVGEEASAPSPSCACRARSLPV